MRSAAAPVGALDLLSSGRASSCWLWRTAAATVMAASTTNNPSASQTSREMAFMVWAGSALRLAQRRHAVGVLAVGGGVERLEAIPHAVEDIDHLAQHAGQLGVVAQAAQHFTVGQ